MYLPTVMVIKVTFFLFFERVFSPNKTMKWLIRGGIFAVVAFYIAIFFRSVFLCKPVALAWNPTLTGSCLKLEVTPYTTAVFNIISDIYILLLPMPLIWNLNLKTQRKMRLIAVFGMGILLDNIQPRFTVSSANRLQRLHCKYRPSRYHSPDNQRC
jgi:hypothetical protein